MKSLLIGFFTLKTCARSSAHRSPVDGPLNEEDLPKFFYPWKTPESSFVYRRRVEGKTKRTFWGDKKVILD